jgi:predicted nuclease of predicted toxin-antitoxin system
VALVDSGVICGGAVILADALQRRLERGTTEEELLAVVERCPGATDDEVIALSVEEGRVLLTEDKDFGQLVFAANRESAGVILIRFPAEARGTLPTRVVQTAEREREALRGAFVVIQPRRTRLTRLPS